MASPRKKVAVIVDADNIPAKYADVILEHAAKYGDIILSNAYGNEKHIKSWETTERTYHCITTPTDSQSTDMTIAFVLGFISGRRPDIDTFCIVTNDKHFRTLFHLFEPTKKYIYGFTLQKQGKSLRSGFSNFRILELPPEPEPKDPLQPFIELLTQAMPKNTPINLSQLKDKLLEIEPNFSYKDYGSSKPSKLLKHVPHIIKLTNGNKTATRIK